MEGNYHTAILCVCVCARARARACGRAGMQYAACPPSAKNITSLSNKLLIEDGRFVGCNAVLGE